MDSCTLLRVDNRQNLFTKVRLKGLLQFVIECGLECRIQGNKRFMRRGSAGCLSGSMSRHTDKLQPALLLGGDRLAIT